MTLAAGAKLGRYEILGPLGSGGMGEVYRARDSRLGRDVAVKVLPSHLSSRPDLRERFEREAKLISQLAHPNVCTLHDVGSDGGIDFLVMELLEGQSLAMRLARGALPVDEVLTFGAQIAAGLAAAHRRGIVHRDLKPGNVMVTRSGVRLLDFGLARIAATPDPPSEPSSPTESLENVSLTRAGILIGTLQYMAPEQVEGKPADARTDIFSLGAVLYEMLTGAKAFAGGSTTALMAGILTAEPAAMDALAPSAPAALPRLIRTCLAKDPNDRWQSAHDIGLHLASIQADAGQTPGREQRGRGRLPGGLVSAAALTMAGVAALFLVARQPASHPAPIRFRVAPPEGQAFKPLFETLAFALSPDGTSLAFIAEAAQATQGPSRSAHSSLRIWLRRLSDLEAKPLPGSEGANSVFWSPDGRSIGFVAEGHVRRIEIAGGSSAPICDLPTGTVGAGSWGADAILFRSGYDQAIYRVSPDGGPPTAFIRPDPGRGETRVLWPWFLPGGKTFLYVAEHKDGTGELMFSSADGAVRAVGPITSRVEFFEPGYLAFAQDGVLFAQRFDAKSAQLSGPPLPLAPTVSSFYSNRWAAFSLSRSGVLAYAPRGNTSRLAWFDRAGHRLSEIGSDDAGNTGSVSISPDGRRALFDRTRPETGTLDVWLIDLASGLETRVTSDPDTELSPRWFPDGRHIVYSVVKGGLPRLVLRDLTDGREEPLLPAGPFQEALDVTPDGRSLLFSQTGGESATYGLWMLPLAGPRRPEPLSVSKYTEEIGHLSHDGRLLAFISDESGQFEAYVAPAGSPQAKVRLSMSGATAVAWSRDGRGIYFTSRDRRLMTAPIAASPSLRVGTAVPLFELSAQGWSTFDVAPDGRFLAAVQEVSDATEPLAVTLNGIPGRQD
ncbi:MAG TPA: protein kinase [Vicinamibacteria bacterium]|nr:protein kinase [Vicinamibacteria bacterium]